MTMSSSPKSSTHGDWRIFYGSQDEQDERVADGRKTLAHTLSLPNSMCILSDSKTETPTVTELDPPKLKLPQLGSETIERVFPVRSVLSFDSTPSSALQTPSCVDKSESPFSPFSEGSRASGSLDQFKQTFHEPGNRKCELKRPNSLAQLQEQRHELGDSSRSTLKLPLRSDRFTPKGATCSHTDEISEYKDGGSKLDYSQNSLEVLIRECGYVLETRTTQKGIQYSRDDDDDSEVEIHNFGVVLVIFELEGSLTIQAVSNNSKDILGYSPDELFELPSICDVLPDSYHQVFVSHAERVLSDEYAVELSGPEVFALLIKGPMNDGKRLWCTMHTSKVYQDYIICEFELENSNHHAPETSEVEGSENIYRECRPHMVEESRIQSTISSNTCSDLLPPEIEVVNNLASITHGISNSQTIDALSHQIVSGLQRLLQVHRVTVYRFDANRNGVVLADSVEPSLGIDSFKAARFNSGDFPKNMKQSFLRNSVCFSYGHKENTAQLVCRSSTNRLGLDLSHCYLVTPQGNTAREEQSSIQGCMSIGIHVFGELWGIVCCQSYDENFRFHPLLQRASWLVSDTIKSTLERLSYTLPYQPKDPSDLTADRESNGQGDSSSDILTVFGADFAAASVLDETRILGKPPDSQEVLALLEYIRAKDLDSVLWSKDILNDFEDLEYSPGFHHLSGLLYIPLSNEGHDFIILFRSDNATSSDQSTSQSDHRETEPNQAEWPTAELSKASLLAMIYRAFTDIWQERRSAMQDNQLLKLLLANSAHEFRTPLNAIINYLEIALDGNLNQETRENISRSHSASKSLIYIINDLLDLTNAENGQDLIKDEVFSLSETLCEATDIFWEEARQKQVDLQVVQHSALPPVLGDQRRVRQIITNLICNAVQHTSAGAVTIESCMLSESCEPGHIAIEVAIHDTGSGMPQETVETLFCQLEQVSNKGYIRDHQYGGKMSGPDSSGKDCVLGLGLALVARIVRNMNGQLSLKSEEGSGSCFKIRLKFRLPEEDDQLQASSEILDRLQNDSVPCEKYQSNEKEDESDPLVFRCGDDVSNVEELGQQDGSLVDVDVEMESGQSRSIAISSSEQATIESTTGPNPAPKTDSTDKMNILVAEDDPINSTILRKRLEKFGYSVCMTGNGKECAALFRESPRAFDAVLMDLQVSINRYCYSQ